MLGACAEAALTKSNAITTRTPDRAQHCRGKEDRFIGTSLHDGGEVTGCVLCAAVTAAPSRNSTRTPVLRLLKNPAIEKPDVHHSWVFKKYFSVQTPR